MKILVTGGAGFIGSHVVSHYQESAEVVVLDNFRTGHRSNLAGMRCSLLEGSILDTAAVEQAVTGADIVFHLAAMVSVPESMSSPVEAVRINVTGLLNVLEASRPGDIRCSTADASRLHAAGWRPHHSVMSGLATLV